MQAHLDLPDQVSVTGRAERAHSPASWRVWVRQYRTITLALVVPMVVPVAVAVYLLLRVHWPAS